MLKKISIVALAFLLCGAVQAADFGADPNADGSVAVRDNIHPLAPTQITQSVDPTQIVAGNGISCGSGGITTDTSWFRLFDLDLDHGLTGTFTTEDVDWGAETITGSQDVNLFVHCLDDGLPFLKQFLTQVGTSIQPVTDGALVFYNTALIGACDADTQSMAVEIYSFDCLDTGLCINLYPGGNDLGQTGPTYIAADDCGITDPTDLAGIGFPNAALVMVVNGDGTGGTGDGGSGDGGSGDDGGVPATTGIGLMLLVLALGGGSAYFVRRK